MAEVSPGFSGKLSRVDGAGGPNACHQRSACAAGCPAARHHPDSNPRLVATATPPGVGELLTGPGSVIRRCTPRYKPRGRCPQGTHPIDITTVLKNSATRESNAPGESTSWYDDTEGGGKKSMGVDMVVLSTAFFSPKGIDGFSAVLGFEMNGYCFFEASDDLLAPMDISVPGIYIAGARTRPMDATDAFTRGGGAAGRTAQAIAR